MRIAYIGSFKKLWDEEYIARAFEALGHTVGRIPVTSRLSDVTRDLDVFGPNLVLWAKLKTPWASELVDFCRARGYRTACWVFDLYWNYHRERELASPAFMADYVFTTDGGDHPWERYGVRHRCVRQGIHRPECSIETVPLSGKDIGVLFVGTYNPNNPERNATLAAVDEKFGLTWVGKEDADECRGMKLNRLYARAHVVIGDSVYSPGYWSNRVVETLGRGGFLIHQEVEGLKEEYPNLATYRRGDTNDLLNKIAFYLGYHDKREAAIRANFEKVRDNYTCEDKCRELLELCR